MGLLKEKDFNERKRLISTIRPDSTIYANFKHTLSSVEELMHTMNQESQAFN